MYFWDTKKLANELTSDALTQRNQYKYFLATSILYAIAMAPTTGTDAQTGLFDFVASLLLTIVGINYCYKINSKGDNKDFIVRMLCLGWTIGFKLFILTTIFLICYVISVSIFVPLDEVNFFLYNADFFSILMVFFFIIYYWRISVHMKSVTFHREKSNHSLKRDEETAGVSE